MERSKHLTKPLNSLPSVSAARSSRRLWPAAGDCLIKHLYFILACLILSQASLTSQDYAFTPYFWSIGMAVFAYFVSEALCSSVSWLRTRQILYVVIQSIVGFFLFLAELMGLALIGKEFESLYKLLNTMSLVKEDIFLVLYSTVIAGLAAHLTSFCTRKNYSL